MERRRADGGVVGHPARWKGVNYAITKVLKHARRSKFGLYSSYGAAAGSPQLRRLQYFKLRVALTILSKLKLQCNPEI